MYRSGSILRWSWLNPGWNFAADLNMMGVAGRGAAVDTTSVMTDDAKVMM